MVKLPEQTPSKVVFDSPEIISTTANIKPVLFGAYMVLFVVGLLLLFGSNRLNRRWKEALVLTIVLVAYFFLGFLVLPKILQSGWSGGLVLAASFLLFKIMGNFEAPNRGSQ